VGGGGGNKKTHGELTTVAGTTDIKTKPTIKGKNKEKLYDAVKKGGVNTTEIHTRMVVTPSLKKLMKNYQRKARLGIQ